jgi:hypothetical protein
MATKDLAPTATPENTPIPGGGRWRWDATLPGWVEVVENPAPTPAAAPADQPIEMKE